MGRLRVLITNIALTGRSGTEVVVRDLALALKRLGVDVAVYSPRLGAMAEEIRANGVTAGDDLSLLPEPDVVHGHHHVETVEALLHFPRARGLFVGHDATAWHDRPPRMPRLMRYVAVDRRVGERMMRYPFVRERGLALIPNAVDAARYRPRAPLPQRPSKALVFSNYLAESADLETLRIVCGSQGIALHTAGSRMGTQAAAPETILPDYDIVFGKARCAMEAAVTGCFVVLYHDGMLGVALDGSNIHECLGWNLGKRLFNERLTPAALEARLARYSPQTAAEVSEAVRNANNLDAVARRWLALYESMMAEPVAESPHEQRDYITEMAHTVAQLELEWSVPVMPALPASVVDRVTFQLLYAPLAVRCGQQFDVQVLLNNESLFRLMEAPPHPVRFGCAWIQGRSRSEAEKRGVLSPPSEPSTAREYRFEQIAPRLPGEYLLRITLVQEQVRWFDSRRGGPRLDLPIVVEAG